jgi:hypothetical protein
MVDRSRLMVDTRKWLLSKMFPKKYGDRVATELSGPDDGPNADGDGIGARDRAGDEDGRTLVGGYEHPVHPAGAAGPGRGNPRATEGDHGEGRGEGAVMVGLCRLELQTSTVSGSGRTSAY